MCKKYEKYWMHNMWEIDTFWEFLDGLYVYHLGI